MLYAGIDLSDLPRLRRCNMGEYAAAFSVSNDQVHHRRLIDCGGKKLSPTDTSLTGRDVRASL